MNANNIDRLSKDAQFIYEIIKRRPYASITVIMKLAYLIDLLAVKKLGKQISNLKYKRYLFGPFVQDVYTLVTDLVARSYIKSDPRFNSDNDYSVLYINDENKQEVKSELQEKELNLIVEVCNGLQDCSAKQLTEVTYKTEPMRKLGATLGGSEHLNESLDLQAEK